MAEQFLDGADVGTRLQQVRDEAVAQRVRRGRLGDDGGVQRVLEGMAKRLGVQMMAAQHAAAQID